MEWKQSADKPSCFCSFNPPRKGEVSWYLKRKQKSTSPSALETNAAIALSLDIQNVVRAKQSEEGSLLQQFALNETTRNDKVHSLQKAHPGRAHLVRDGKMQVGSTRLTPNGCHLAVITRCCLCNTVSFYAIFSTNDRMSVEATDESRTIDSGSTPSGKYPGASVNRSNISARVSSG